MGKHYQQTQEKLISQFERAIPRKVCGWLDRCPRVEYRVYTAPSGKKTAFLTMPQNRPNGDFALSLDAWSHVNQVDAHLPLYGICTDLEDYPVRVIRRGVIAREIERQCEAIRRKTRGEKSDPWWKVRMGRSSMLYIKKDIQPVRELL